jgi:hypothetical protein
MDVENLLNMRDHLARNNALMSFNGMLSQPLLEDMGKALRRHVAEDPDASQSKIRDVFEIFIEQTQNIEKYAKSTAADTDEADFLKKAIVVISATPCGYMISSVNPVRQTDIPSLAEHLTRINDMTKDELRRHYKNMLKQPQSDKFGAGAGVGLINMARRSQAPFEWCFAAFDSTYKQFMLCITV